MSKIKGLHSAHAKPYRANKIIETILNKNNKIKRPLQIMEVAKHDWNKK
jgi:hypothetical protein